MRVRNYVAAAAIGLAVTVAGTVSPATADDTSYTGAITCSVQKATTASVTWAGTHVEHRAQGHSGWWSATLPAYPWATPHSKNWGWYGILDSNITIYGPGWFEWTGKNCNG